MSRRPIERRVAPTRERLQSIISYDPETGIFRWIKAPRRGDRRLIDGSRAGTITRHGYREIALHGWRSHAARVAWFYMTGEWPVADIDHINGNRSDDHWVNLRSVDRSTNLENRHGAACDSQTGFLGVSTHKNKFRAAIGVKGKSHYLGLFETPEAAYAAYLKAKRHLHEGCTI